MSEETNFNNAEKEYRHYRATRRASFHFFTAFICTLFPTIILPFIFAPLSITYAYLAKGKRKKNDWYNNLIIFFSVILILVNGIFFGYAIYSVNHDTLLHKQFEEASRQMYGMSFEEYLNEQLNGPSVLPKENSIEQDENSSARSEGNDVEQTKDSSGKTEEKSVEQTKDSSGSTDGTTVKQTDGPSIQQGGDANE